MKALVLLSGGLDSTVLLAKAVADEKQLFALSFDYGQRNYAEIKAAARICAHYGVNHKLIKFDSQTFDNSSLVYKSAVPKNRTLSQINSGSTPSTYVPARNTLFLAYAAAQAESLEIDEIYFGVNAADQLAYPDTRPIYLQTFQSLLDVASKRAVEGNPPKLVCPHIHSYKKEIIALGMHLKAPLHLSLSCYDPEDGIHCGQCDACYLRKRGFIEAECADPTKYIATGMPLDAASLVT